MTTITAPERTEAAEYYFTYIDQVGRGDICGILEHLHDHATIFGAALGRAVVRDRIGLTIAARAHLRWIVPVLDEAWSASGASWDDVAAVAVTYGPGLAGSLLVGINFAKALAWVHDKPLVGVNHLEGHVYAAWLADAGAAGGGPEEPVFPLVALVVSGGHTFLVEMRDHLTYRLLGQTVGHVAILWCDLHLDPCLRILGLEQTRHRA